MRDKELPKGCELPRHRAWPVSVAPAQSPRQLHRWEVDTPPTSTRDGAFRLPAVPATLRASTEPNSAALRTAKDIDFLSHIWLPAILHHP